MPEAVKQPNIYDVAKLAGVSHQTVSRVINNGSSVRPSTRDRVLQSMESLAYVPNAAARALVTAKSKIIGVLVSDSLYHGPSQMAHALEVEARKAGYFTISASVDPLNDESILAGINHLRRVGIEALVVITPQSNAVKAVESVVTNIPVVFFDSPNPSEKFSANLDNFSGARLATQHLIDLGHKKILHVSGPMSWFAAPPRFEGYRSAMEQAGLEPRVIEGNWTVQSGFEIGSSISIERSGITAIFSANDHLALGLMRALRERGYQVPQRISIIGFDDIPEAAFYEPPLTTINPDFNELGVAALEMILGSLENLSSKPFEPTLPELIVRQSTTAPPKL